MKWLAVVLAAVAVVAIGVALWVNSGSTAHAPTVQAANHDSKPIATDATPLPLADGIYGGSQAPYSTEEFMSNNMWIGQANTLRILIYAGSEGRSARDSGRGLLIVDTYSDQVAGGSYYAPLGVGALSVVSYQGTMLTIQSADGQTFYFDAESRAFTDANGNPVATDTPTPTPEPSPGGTLPFPTDTLETTATPTPTAMPSLASAPSIGVGG